MVSKKSSSVIHSEFVHIIPEHESHLCHKLYQQWQGGQQCDLVLSVKGGELRAHSCVVAAFSPKMQVLLETENSAGSGNSDSGGAGFFVHLTFEMAVVRCLLNMMYTGVLSFNTAILSSVMSTARWMQMDDVVRHCQAFREVTENYSDEELLTDEAVLCEVDSSDIVKIEQISPFSQPQIGTLEHVLESQQHLSDLSGTDQNIEADPPQCGTECQKKRRRRRVGKAKTKSENMNVPSQVGRKRAKPPKVGPASLTITSPRKNRRKGKIRDTTPAESTEYVEAEADGGNSIQTEEEEEARQTCDPEDETPTVFFSPAYTQEISSPTTKTIKKRCAETHFMGDSDQDEVNFALGKADHINCKRCLQKFTVLEEYFQHVTNHPTFPCDLCEYKYFRKSNLTRHMRTQHSDVHHLRCRKCPVVARTESSLRGHYKEAHQDSKPFVCEHPGCTYSAWKFDFLNRHLEIHREVKQYICNKCGQSFSQDAGLKSHQRACFRLQEFLCDLCGQAFNHLQSMRAHRRTIHFGEKKFFCRLCTNRFSDQRNLKRHMLIHENSFPYQCPICQQKYRHSNSLKAHLKKHGDNVGVNLNLVGIAVDHAATQSSPGGGGAKRKFKRGRPSGYVMPENSGGGDGGGGAEVEERDGSEEMFTNDSGVIPGSSGADKDGEGQSAVVVEDNVMCLGDDGLSCVGGNNAVEVLAEQVMMPTGGDVGTVEFTGSNPEPDVLLGSQLLGQLGSSAGFSSGASSTTIVSALPSSNSNLVENAEKALISSRLGVPQTVNVAQPLGLSLISPGLLPTMVVPQTPRHPIMTQRTAFHVSGSDVTSSSATSLASLAPMLYNVGLATGVSLSAVSADIAGSTAQGFVAGMKMEEGETQGADADRDMKGQTSYGLQTLAEICFHSAN